MSNYKDFRNKDTEFTGEKGIDLPEGATSTRVNEKGRLRFNSETGLAEYYNGTIWKSIDAPPAVQTVSPSTVATDGSTLFSITVSGTGFDSGGITGTFIGSDGTEYNSAVNTFNSATEVVLQTTATMNAANGPYDVKVTNTGSSLSGTLADGLSGGSVPSFSSPSADANLGNIFNGQTASAAGFTPIVVSDDAGQERSFSISAGSLPAGITLNTNDGSFEGTCTQSDAAADFTFTVQVTDGINTATRQFVISQVLIPVMEVLVVAGGGGGGGGNRGNNNYSGNGGGGAGGYRTGNFNLTSTRTYTVTVGSGGSGGPGGNSSAQSGSNSEISAPGITTITSAGGGYGGRETEPGNSGGSGGGGGARNGEGPGAGSGGSGNSPSVSPSQGSSGGGGANDKTGGGGGGASQSGQGGGGSNSSGSPGGNGTANNITGSSVTYAGGGGGGIHGPSGNNTQGPGGSGGGGTGGRHNGPQNGTSGTANLGGGGGGSGPANTGQGSGGSGGSGVVILKVPTFKYSGTTTGSPTVTTDGTDTIIKFTGSGSYNG